MFKKFKDKLAEEVKSSPQRLQQFAQAAQAAVTSASSSISDITNNDLFSIGDSDSGSKSQTSTNSQQSTFRDASPIYHGAVQLGPDLVETTMSLEESQRQRRLSTSSLASDVSFRLPNYESPSMYHLQSDMEVSASEAEEKGFTGGPANLDRVTKEQLYSAYRHTHDRCKKYKTQYADLARHYKLLERENAKAKNVLVETQDKALRRISELREQCSLEQSAKAHLERALRIEIDEKNMKIHTLNTKLELLQQNPETLNDNNKNKAPLEKESEMQLINLHETEPKESNEESLSSEISVLNNKLEKMEQLLNKYKESLKVVKEKNAQMATEIKILTGDLQTKSKENEELKSVSASLVESKKKIQELNQVIEELQNKCNTFEFTKNKETSILEINLQSAQEDIIQLEKKIEELKKKEEEYAISLAENKLSIHKELESKEAEIKSLKDSLTEAQNEIQSLQIVIDDYKNNISALEAERLSLNSDIKEYNAVKNKMKDTEVQAEELRQKCHSLENAKTKLDEQFKCLQLQMKQETAEKLAMIDRNTYLESRNAQLVEENTKKSSQIHDLESVIESHSNNEETKEADINIVNEISLWKTKYENLEREIQDEREELVKLQSEIEKLLRNYELLQTKNIDLIQINSDIKKDNILLQDKNQKFQNLKIKFSEVNSKVKELREFINIIHNDTKLCLNFVNKEMFSVLHIKILLFNEMIEKEKVENKEIYDELKINYDLSEKELKNISNKYTVTKKELQMLYEENNNYKLKIENCNSDMIDMKEKMQSAAKQHEKSLEEIFVLKEEIDTLKRKIEINDKHNINVVENLKTLEIENQNLREKLKDSDINIQLLNKNLISEKELSKEKIQNISEQYEVVAGENTSLKRELENFKQKAENDDQQRLNIGDSLRILETENRNLQDKLTDSQNIIELLKIDLNKEKDVFKKKIEEMDVLSTKCNSLIIDNNDKQNLILTLQENIENLTQDKLALKNLSETISVNVNELQSEMNDLRKSHAEIEREKNHLCTIIEQLEQNQLKTYPNMTSDMNLPTDFLKNETEQTYKENEIKVENTTISEDVIRDIDMVNSMPHSNKSNHQDDETLVVGDIEQRYCALQNENEIFKEENRRLQSDVEGLQKYLAKISKENSLLNDKLREYIASGDNVPDKNEAQCYDIKGLQSEIESGKELIENLMRENTILVEENLELKDQIQSQSYNRITSEYKTTHNNNNTEQELQGYKDKYNSLLDAKTKLEKRLDDVEQVNQSVTVNMNQMQINNEKLRLCNEKLERRLDEALVSLRHLHSLQENTELEYLRNILYEYLTGSGTHSLTLAKVLSAVVKFSDSQTDLVLQKERERQGFLRQMGLL